MATVSVTYRYRYPFPGDETRSTPDFFLLALLPSFQNRLLVETHLLTERARLHSVPAPPYPHRPRLSKKKPKSRPAACCDNRAGISLHPPIRRPANSWSCLELFGALRWALTSFFVLSKLQKLEIPPSRSQTLKEKNGSQQKGAASISYQPRPSEKRRQQPQDSRKRKRNHILRDGTSETG